jgi:hypothetical protein
MSMMTKSIGMGVSSFEVERSKRARTRMAVLGTVAAACTIAAACSSSSSPSVGPGPAPGSGAVEFEQTLVGCTSTAAGCYTTNGKAYATPSVSTSCTPEGKAAPGPADTHCKGATPQAVEPSACGVTDAGMPADAGSGDAGAEDAGPRPGLCGENGPDYGATMYGREGDDDDCKYHVTYTTSPICRNDGTYFVVTAEYLTRSGAPLTGACTFAELCLNDSHAAPNVDQRPPTGDQIVVEGPPGTYTIGPILFDEPGDWTVRFHFNELCCDVLPGSPHGHAAFHIDVP